MRPRRSTTIFLICVFLAFSQTLVFARRPVRDLPSSDKGFNDPVGICASDNPTPFGVALTGKVTAVSSDPFSTCAFTDIYPNYTLPLTPQDGSFTLKIIPILWESAGGSSGRSTIL